MTPTQPADKPRHPKGLYVLFFTEMWERFSFYLMIGIFYLYLVDSQTGGMGWDGKKAAGVVGTYLALVYFTPFLGGIIADRLLGYRITVVLGGLSMGLGHVLLAFPTEMMLYLALAALIIGNGLFKPNISTMVGRMYPADSPLRDRAYTIFYMGINIGAFICNFVAAVVRSKWGWHWAFATAGFGMAIGVIVFIAGQKYIRQADITREERAAQPKQSLAPLFVECLAPAAVLFAIGMYVGGQVPFFLERFHPTTTAFLFACVPVVYFFIRIWSQLTDKGERGRVAALLTIFGVVTVFWMVFHQNSTALTEWAKNNTDREPSALIAPIVNLAPDFAETAPPEYFYNADPTVPRPARESFQIVPDEEYAALEKAKKLSVEDGKPVIVNQEIFDKVFAGATAATPTLEPGKQLKLVNTELFQSINPGFVMLLAPLMVGLWSLLMRKGKEPSMPGKIGVGLVITGLSALVMVAAVKMAGTPEGKVSALWLFGTYGVITVGELCLSPIGLSLVSRLSPKRITAFMMGGWFMSTAIGNKLSGVFGEVYHEWDHTVFFTVNAVVAVAAGGVIFALLPWLRRQMAAGDGPDVPREVSAEVVPTGPKSRV
jgi:proton-dependent oligopeptide transporter, POT family